LQFRRKAKDLIHYFERPLESVNSRRLAVSLAVVYDGYFTVCYSYSFEAGFSYLLYCNSDVCIFGPFSTNFAFIVIVYFL